MLPPSLPPLLLTACIGVTRAPAPTAIPPDPPGALRVSAVGDIADCRHGSPAESMAARTAALVPPGELVLALGDMAYQYADAQTLASCYEPTWGLHRRTTIAIPGNHDYVAGNASAFIDYFRPVSAPGAGFIAHTRRLTDHWRWSRSTATCRAVHSRRSTAGWIESLAEDAKASRRTPGLPARHVACAACIRRGCIAAPGDHLRPFWRLLDEYGADLVLSGHEHFYERFGPLDADGRVPPDGEAPRQFVVGTGGTQLYGFWKPPYRSKARVLDARRAATLARARGATRGSFIDVDGRVQRCRRGALSRRQ